MDAHGRQLYHKPYLRHGLYVNGKEYTEGTASTGTAIEVKSTGGSGAPDSPPDGKPGENGGSGGTPPAKPGEN